MSKSSPLKLLEPKRKIKTRQNHSSFLQKYLLNISIFGVWGWGLGLGGHRIKGCLWLCWFIWWGWCLWWVLITRNTKLWNYAKVQFELVEGLIYFKNKAIIISKDYAIKWICLPAPHLPVTKFPHNSGRQRYCRLKQARRKTAFAIHLFKWIRLCCVIYWGHFAPMDQVLLKSCRSQNSFSNMHKVAPGEAPKPFQSKIKIPKTA